MEPLQTFAQNLRRLRERKGLSQEALGDACQLHRTAVSLLERAQREPRLNTIVQLSRGLGVRPCELFDGIE